MLEIIYEDKVAIAAVKPAGMLSQSASNDEPTSSGSSTNAADEITAYLRENGCGPAGMINRLDCAVGGIMLFGKTSAATARLSEALRRGEIKKEYLTVVRGILPEKSGTMRDYLVRDNKRNLTKTAAENTHGAKYAELEYEVLSEYETDFGMSSLLLIRLITGRTHQIRAQLSSRGLPIIGDRRYGGDGGAKIALYSFRITFPSGGTNKIVTSLPASEYPYRKEDLAKLG